jgi:hypothetical protein
MVELFITLVIGIGIAAGSFYIGWRSHERVITNSLLETLRELIIDLRLEQINDTYFLYRETSNEFVCQASSLDEVATNFAKNLGQDYIGIFNYNNQDVYIVDGKIQHSVTVEKL